MRPDLIIVTSNYPIHQIWPNAQDCAPLERRFHQVEMHTLDDPVPLDELRALGHPLQRLIATQPIEDTLAAAEILAGMSEEEEEEELSEFDKVRLSRTSRVNTPGPLAKKRKPVEESEEEEDASSGSEEPDGVSLGSEDSSDAEYEDRGGYDTDDEIVNLADSSSDDE